MRLLENMGANNTIADTAFQKKSFFSPVLFLAYALLICPFIIAYPKTELAYLIIRLLQLPCVVMWFILQIFNRFQITQENKPFVFSIHLWWIVLIANTFYQVPIFQLTQVYYWLTIWNFILMAKIYWAEDFKQHLYQIGILLSFLIYLNTILYICFPDGLWEDTEWIGLGDKTRYLFGNYNQTGIVSLMAIMVWGVYTLISGRGYMNMIGLMACSLGTVIGMGSMTSTIGILLICTYFILHKRIKHPFFWISIFIAIYIAFFILIVWLGKDLEESPALADFVVNVLQKNTTFSERSILWLNSVLVIQESPIIGFGVQNTEWMMQHIDGSGPHNIWLMLLLQGGVVSLTIVIGIIVILFHKLRKQNHTICSFAAICIAALLLMSLFETYYIICVFQILILAYQTVPIAEKMRTYETLQ